VSKRYSQTGVSGGLEIGKGGAFVRSGAGTPEGAVTGSVGDVFLRSDGAAGTSFYVKETGTATNTGWVAYSAGGGGSSKRKWVTNHGFNQTSISENFIPINNLAESTAADYFMKVLCPLACKITKVVVWPTSAACGSTDVKAYQYDGPDTGATQNLLKTVNVDMNASQAWEFDFSGDPPLYSANELAGISIDTTADGPDQTVCQIHWEEQ